jgi:hypothetical protein
MINEAVVLEVVGKITPAKAYFFEGTLFVETTDSEIAVKVFNALRKEITKALAFGKVGNETSYDFL